MSNCACAARKGGGAAGCEICGIRWYRAVSASWVEAHANDEKLGLSADEVFELGLANLRRELPPLMSVAKFAAAKQIGNMAGSVYNPSRMVLEGSWAPLAEAQGGVLIVAIPATDAVFYVGEILRRRLTLCALWPRTSRVEYPIDYPTIYIGDGRAVGSGCHEADRT